MGRKLKQKYLALLPQSSALVLKNLTLLTSPLTHLDIK
jgi:hypothetical protein